MAGRAERGVTDGEGLSSFAKIGALHFPRAAKPILNELRSIADSLPTDRAGIRLLGIPRLSELLQISGGANDIASQLIGAPARPVRAVLFDKSEAANWALGWHQDRTICVRKRHDHAGFGPWSVKQGIQHVEPPFSIMERMVTLRVHLDDVPDTNAPLLVLIGSHQLGRVPIEQIAQHVAQRKVLRCHAVAGEIWAYSTPILHASDKAVELGRRRVLQLDYSADRLPEPLEWLGI